MQLKLIALGLQMVLVMWPSEHIMDLLYMKSGFSVRS
jgi:hypothetical protein